MAQKKKPIALIAGAAVLVLALAGFGVYTFGPGGKSGGLSDEALSAMKIAPVLSGGIYFIQGSNNRDIIKITGLVK